MSSKTRSDMHVMKKKYCKTFGVTESDVVTIDFETETGVESFAIAARGHPVWTLAGKAPSWFVREMAIVTTPDDVKVRYDVASDEFVIVTPRGEVVNVPSWILDRRYNEACEAGDEDQRRDSETIQRSQGTRGSDG